MSARENIIPVFVPHRGCPHACVFCNQHRITGQEETATAETVRQAVEAALRDVPEATNRQLAFYGGSFTAIPAEEQVELLRAGKGYLERGLIHSIRVSTRPDAISAEVLDRLERYGVRTIELGVQTMDDEVLLRAGRGHTAQDVLQAVQLIRQRDFRLILQMMTGLPGDSGEESLSTARQICALKPDGVRVYPTVILRDTALYDLWQDGRYAEHTVEQAVALCARILPLFEAAGIPVIRLGLNPTEELSAGAAVGGAYHPAFGELVKSRILRGKAEQLLTEQGAERGERVRITIPARQLSQMLGQHRCNVSWLKDRFALAELTVIPGKTESSMKIERFPVENGENS